tara:strand:- start:545 stop:1240 length:696 start_codon:yes stop_codon:yes gene_type:complete
MELFYNEHITSKSESFELNRKETKHITKVLRKREGDYLDFTNGKNEKFKCKIEFIKKNTSTLKIIEYLKYDSSENLHIGISLLKSTSRFENFLEKCTEIGINEITPIVCQRTENKKFNKIRLIKIMVSAMKQSYRFQLPILNDPVNFKVFCKINHNNKLIATCEDFFRKEEISRNIFEKNNLIAIGPEGDFTNKEIELAIENNFKAVSLGKNRLRAETAGIYVCIANSLYK